MDKIPPMKTGFVTSYDKDEQNEMMINFASAFTLFTEDAINISSIYTSHKKRNVVSGNVIVLALRTRFKYRNYFDSKPDTIQRLLTIKEELTNGNEQNFFENDAIIVTPKECNVENDCDCEICKMVIDTGNNWNQYIMENFQSFSPLDLNLVNSIEKAEKKALLLNDL